MTREEFTERIAFEVLQNEDSGADQSGRISVDDPQFSEKFFAGAG